MNIRDFDSNEIAEINIYVNTQIPSSILPKLFILTEEPSNKSKIFVAIYRIIECARDYVETQTTRDKLSIMLKEVENIYSILYPKVIKLDCDIEYEISMVKNEIYKVILNNNFKINNFINNFLVFAEKQQLFETEKVSGVSLEEDFGNELYNKLGKDV